MPTPADRPEGSDDPFAVAEATLDARATVPVERPTEPVRGDDRPPVLVDEKPPGAHPTVKVPGRRRPPGPAKRAPLPVAVAFATTWAAVLCYLPVAAVIGLARTLEGQGGLGGAAHAGLAGWLLGHGVPIGPPIGPLRLPPPLLTLLVVWRGKPGRPPR